MDILLNNFRFFYIYFRPFTAESQPEFRFSLEKWIKTDIVQMVYSNLRKSI